MNLVQVVDGTCKPCKDSISVVAFIKDIKCCQLRICKTRGNERTSPYCPETKGYPFGESAGTSPCSPDMASVIA